MDICAVILAASEDKGMQSERVRFVHDICGRPLIGWLSDALLAAGAKEQLYVVGHRQDQVRRVLGEQHIYVLQEQRKGSGHAVLQASSFLESRSGCTLVLPGDAPLLSEGTLRQVITTFERERPGVLVLATETRSYGDDAEIIRTADGTMERLLFHDEDSSREAIMREVDAGMYCFDTALLLSSLGKVAQGCHGDNFRVQDVINSLLQDSTLVMTYKVPAEEVLVVRDRVDLETVRRRLNRRLCQRHMLAGVTIENPDACFIEADVKLGADVYVASGCRLTGQTTIADGSALGPRTHMNNCVVGRGVRLYGGKFDGAVLGDQVSIGPRAYFHEQVRVGEGSSLGADVDLSYCTLGSYCQVESHVMLRYLKAGDSLFVGAAVMTVDALPPDPRKAAKAEAPPQEELISMVGDNVQIGSLCRLMRPFHLPSNFRVTACSIVAPVKKSILPWKNTDRSDVNPSK